MEDIIKYIDNLPNNIKNDKSFSTDIILNCRKYFKKIKFVSDLENFNIYENEEIPTLFNYAGSNGRGNKLGKGELLITLLVKGCDFSKNSGDLLINGVEYEVKSIKDEKQSISFGVKNTITRYRLGRRLIGLFDSIIDNENNLKNSYWFETYNGRKNNSYSNNNLVYKLSSMEISESDFKNLRKEIPKLKGIIKHPYVDDIRNIQNDIDEFNNEFNDRHEKLIIFTKNKINLNKELVMANITQGKFKMRINN